MATNSTPDHVDWGREYADALQSTESSSWRELRHQFESGQLGQIAALVLIHPNWYANSECVAECSVRGKRRFNFNSTGGKPCQSQAIWGYPCPFESDPIHLDHLFPWSLGGPTDPSNAIWLCRRHNSAKGSDWHLSVQPVGSLNWFNSTLSKLDNLFNYKM